MVDKDSFLEKWTKIIQEMPLGDGTSKKTISEQEPEESPHAVTSEAASESANADVPRLPVLSSYFLQGITELLDDHPRPWRWEMVPTDQNEPMSGQPMVIDAEGFEVLFLDCGMGGTLARMAFADFMVYAASHLFSKAPPIRFPSQPAFTSTDTQNEDQNK